MKSITFALCTLALASMVFAGPPPVPETPAPVEDLVYVRTFTLEKGYQFTWTKENITLTKGTVLVLKVDPALVISRQLAEPVLYVGDQPAERVNIGQESGYVVAIVPGEVDLTKAPIWFGTPELPERVDREMAQAERAQADAAGIKPFSQEKVQAAQTQGGEQVNLADRETLGRDVLAGLIEQYSPQESYLAEQFRIPVNK
jgi:hypothetical protein